MGNFSDPQQTDGQPGQGPEGHLSDRPQRAVPLHLHEGPGLGECLRQTAACAKIWPALTANGTPTIGPGINSTSVDTAHGQIADQVTYYGHLLYYFDGDSAAGQTNGTAVPDWDLLGPFGNVMLPQG